MCQNASQKAATCETNGHNSSQHPPAAVSLSVSVLQVAFSLQFIYFLYSSLHRL